MAGGELLITCVHPHKKGIKRWFLILEVQISAFRMPESSIESEFCERIFTYLRIKLYTALGMLYTQRVRCAGELSIARGIPADLSELKQ